MEPEYHVLGGRVAQPVGLGAVWEDDVFGGEAVLFGECWICFIEIRVNISVPILIGRLPRLSIL